MQSPAGSPGPVAAPKNPRAALSGWIAIAIRIESFIDVDEYKQEIERLVNWVHSSPKLPGVERIYYPGEIEEERRQQRLADGIPIEDSTWNRIVETGDAVGVPAPPAESKRADSKGNVMTSFTKLFRAPYAVPNGLQATDDGLWIVDQITDRLMLVERHPAKLDYYGVPMMIRDIPSESSNTSGMAWGEDSLWLAANGCADKWRPRREKDASKAMGEVLRVDPESGDTISRHPIPNGGGTHGIEYDNVEPGHLWLTHAQKPDTEQGPHKRLVGTARHSFALPTGAWRRACRRRCLGRAHG